MWSCTITHFVNCNHKHKDSIYRLEKPQPSLASLCPAPSLLPRVLSVAHSRGKTRTIPRPIDGSTISPDCWATSATWSENNKRTKHRLRPWLLGTVCVALWRTLSESKKSHSSVNSGTWRTCGWPWSRERDKGTESTPKCGAGFSIWWPSRCPGLGQVSRRSRSIEGTSWIEVNTNSWLVDNGPQ